MPNHVGSILALSRSSVSAFVLLGALGTASAPAAVPESMAGELDTIGQEIRSLRQAGRYDAAIPLAEQALLLCREHDRPPGWRSLEAERQLATLQLIIQLPDTEQARLARADSLPVVFDDLEAEGRYEEASAWAEEAAATYGRLLDSDDPALAEALLHVGASLLSGGRYAEADSALLVAHETARAALGDLHPTTAVCLDARAQAAELLGRLDEAEEMSRAAIVALEEARGREHPETLVALTTLSHILIGRAAYDDAEPVAREIVGIRERQVSAQEEPDDLAIGDLSMAYDALGGVLAFQGRFAEAKVATGRAYELAEAAYGPDHPNTASELNTLAYLDWRTGDLAAADSLWQHVLDIIVEPFGPDHPAVLTVMSNLALARQQRGDLIGAEYYARTSVATYRRVFPDGHRRLALSIAALASIYEEKGDLAEAERLTEESVAMLRATLGDEHRAVALELRSVSALARRRGDLEAAGAYLTEAAGILNTVHGGPSVDLVVVLRDMAEVQAASGDLDLAAATIDTAMTMARSLDAHDGTRAARAHLAAGQIHRLRGDLGMARAQSAEAVVLFHDIFGFRHPEVALAQRELALTLYALGDVAGAEVLLADALETVEERRHLVIGDERARAGRAGILGAKAIATDYARVLVARGQTHEALTAIERGRARALLDLMAREGRDPALEVRATLSPGEQQTFDDIVDAEAIAHREVAEIEASLRVLRQRDDLDDSERTTRTKDRMAELARARSALATAEATLMAELRDHQPLGHPLSANEILEVLEPGDVFLSYAWTSESVLAFVAEPDPQGTDLLVTAAIVAEGRPLVAAIERDLAGLGAALRHAPGDRARGIRDLVDEAFTSVQSESDDTWNTLGDALLPPAVRDRALGARRVIVSPDGPLTAIPFEALPLPGEGSSRAYWIDEGPPVLYAASASTYSHLRDLRTAQLAASTDPAPSATVIVADPDFAARVIPPDSLLVSAVEGGDADLAALSAVDRVRLFGEGLPSLPGSAEEARRVADAVRASDGEATLLIGSDASLPRLREVATQARFLHLATHGLLGSPDRLYDASLALAQPTVPSPDDIGFLTLDELVRSWGGKLDGCELVVLSACDTQRGARAGGTTFALPLGFNFAGAPAVIASLWPVSDESTATLMEAFYRAWLVEGLSKLEAFVAARQATRERYPDPYHWAPFVFSGDPR